MKITAANTTPTNSVWQGIGKLEPICKCGSRMAQRFNGMPWRCRRGHFIRRDLDSVRPVMHTDSRENPRDSDHALPGAKRDQPSLARSPRHRYHQNQPPKGGRAVSEDNTPHHVF